jgi:AraC-like DNA-binding protein
MPVSSHTLKGGMYWKPEFPLFISREREYFTLPIHNHDFVEIQYVAEGRGYHYIGDERLHVEKGDMFIIPVGTRHVYRPASPAPKDELIVYNCLFAPELPDRIWGAFPDAEPIRRWLSAADGTKSYKRYRDAFHEGRMHMEAMHREYKMKQPGYKTALYAVLTRLLVYLYRLETHAVSVLPASGLLGPVLEYLEDHYARAVTVNDLARLVPASPGYLQRIFKRATGQTITEYTQNLRIKKSMELLAATSLPVKDIAEKVGYRDLKFFYALFRKKTGRSPGEYRKHHLTAPHEPVGGSNGGIVGG